MIPKPVIDWIKDNGFGNVVSTQPVGGGCINNSFSLNTSTGKTFFLKTNQHVPADMFAQEAVGLKELYLPAGPRVPRPYTHGSDFLLLEHLNPIKRAASYWDEFGTQLAYMHNVTRERFGFQHDNYIGRTPQINTWQENGYDFFREQRLRNQARRAHKIGLLDRNAIKQVERLGEHLNNLIPLQPASLIHGDLWSGNVITDDSGAPAIIDPATHFGWAEADLAMTSLFGAFPNSFFQAYQEVRPLENGFRERFPIYNLYHLLNHLNMFGTGYLTQVLSILRYFSG